MCHAVQGVRNQAMGKKVARDQQVHGLQQRLEEAAGEGLALRKALGAKQQAVGSLEGRLLAQRKRIMQLERAHETERDSHHAVRSQVQHPPPSLAPHLLDDQHLFDNVRQ